MSKEYDEITAGHYKAFRPALHTSILEKCINEGEVFSLGLDVGCGTGQSAHALANFCQAVKAIEPSRAMLENALPHPKIDYLPYDTNSLKFKTESFEIVTFAGSLFYCKSQRLLDNVVDVCKNRAAVIVYDFEILLEALLEKLGFKAIDEASYDHEVDFSGLQTDRLDSTSKGKELTHLKIKPTDLAHLILSVKDPYSFFRDKWGAQDTHRRLSRALDKISGSGQFVLEAVIFYSRYRVLKK